jgi:hypothetical protein
MGWGPPGVAIGVSGSAQTQPGQPTGQVPLTGAAHCSTLGPKLIMQQSWPEEQQMLPQQTPPVLQAAPSHGGVPHLPLSQYGFGPVQELPQLPQLLMSLCGFTHDPLQQLSP